MEVKDEDDRWGDIREETVRVVKKLLESAMDEELFASLRASRYRRTDLRRGYRNGYRERSLLTELGLIESLRIPRDRQGSYHPRVVERYQRRQEKVNRLIRECFLAGVSTRRVGEVLSPVLGEAPSPQTVSRVARSLDTEVGHFHKRGGVRKRLVLCAYGITLNGIRELIGFRQATAESEAQGEAFLRDLYDRALEGKELRLVSTDGCPGLHRALDTVYPYVARQRCWAHKLRNVAAKLRRRNQADCLRQAKAIYQAETSQINQAGIQSRIKSKGSREESPY